MAPNDPNAPPDLRDKRTPPSGVLPKNTQAWVLAGLAVVMVVVIALSGHNAPKERAVGSLAPTASAGPNAAQIQEYETQLKAEAQKLQVAKEQLTRTQQSFAAMPASSAGASLNYAGVSRPMPEESGAENPALSDMRKREQQSLFASNIALSYRQTNAPPPPPTPTSPADVVAKALAAYIPPGSATAAATPSGAQPAPSATSQEDAERAANTRAAARDAEIDRAEGQDYRLFEGTMFETVLTNRLDGSFSGPVNGLVTTDVYSHNGRHVLVPQGSRILGEARKVETFGDTRLAVVFHRLIMPDGYSVSLDKFHGLDQIGETGLEDQINHHYLQIFGVSIALGLVAGFSQANTTVGIGESATDAYRQGVASSLSQSSTHILDRYLNVLPTITIREGHRVKVYLSDDLLLPAYEKHQMSGDL